MRMIPPYLFVLCVFFMIALHLFIPILRWLHFPLTLLGILFALGGIVLGFRAIDKFREEHTTLEPFGSPDRLITTGIYRSTRNPIYLGFILVLVGIWVMLGSLSPVLGVLLFFLGVNNFYVPMEEKKLGEKFGPAYREYQARTRRWV